MSSDGSGSEQTKRELREWRRSRFLTQGELADQLGVSVNAISNWEQGIKRPSLRHLKKLAEFYGVTYDQLILPAKGEESPAA